jgi:hypothetical protein
MRWEGYTPGYHRVAVVVPADVDLANRIVDVCIDAVGADGGHLVAGLCD